MAARLAFVSQCCHGIEKTGHGQTEKCNSHNTSFPTVSPDRRSGLARNDHPFTIVWEIHKARTLVLKWAVILWIRDSTLQATAVLARRGAQNLTKHATQVGVT